MESVGWGCGVVFGGCRFPCAVVVGDDEVPAVAGADVLGAAVDETGLECGVYAQAIGGATLQPGGELIEGSERLGVGAHVEGCDVADEGPQDGLLTPGAELDAGAVGEGLGLVDPRRPRFFHSESPP
jgi:hypothetical protein